MIRGHVFLLSHLVTVTLGLQVPLTPPPISNLSSLTLSGNGAARQVTTLKGGYNTCYLTNLLVGGRVFTVQVDTGSSDTILPWTGLNNYQTGSEVMNYAIPAGKEQVVAEEYGDGSWWYGYPVRVNVTLNSTNVNALAPVILMTKQSTLPIFASGAYFSGLMGVAFPSLSVTTATPITVIDAWVGQNASLKNQIAFHGCPYISNDSAWLDIGNTTPYQGCNSNQLASVMMPKMSYYNIDLAGINVGGQNITLPTGFQQNVNEWSFVDSCTSNIVITSGALAVLKTQIKQSGGLSPEVLNSPYVDAWLANECQLQMQPTDLNFTLLPNISFTINTLAFGNSTLSTVVLTLGPRQYIQSDSAGNWAFMVAGYGDTQAILGLPFFSAYHILVDRTIGKLYFKLGCGCESSVDGYPTIETQGRAIEGWKLPSSTSTSNVSSSTESPIIEITPTSSFTKTTPILPRLFSPYINSSSSLSILQGWNTVFNASSLTFGFINSNTNLASLPGLTTIKTIGNGKATLSFGGPTGNEIAIGATSSTILRNSYASFLSAYTSSTTSNSGSGISGIDIYLTESNLKNRSVTDIRSKALQALQSTWRPSSPIMLQVTLSFHAVPGVGLSSNAVYAIQSAIKYGIKIKLINLWTMNFGSTYAPNAKSGSGTYCIASANAAYSQIQALDKSLVVGLTPFIGLNPANNELFSIADAKQLVKWASGSEWVRLLSFWSLGVDSGKVDTATSSYEFSNLFNTFVSS